jgi:hypothetical protein
LLRKIIGKRRTVFACLLAGIFIFLAVASSWHIRRRRLNQRLFVVMGSCAL